MVKRKLGQTTESSTMEESMHQPGPEISNLAYHMIKEMKIRLTIETGSSSPYA